MCPIRPSPIRRSAARSLGFVVAGCAFASACAPWVDADQARICRSALPAIEPAGTKISIDRIASGDKPGTVRIDYRATPPGGSADAPHFALCGFAAANLSADKADLTGIATERGAIAGATVYLLKRYYLDTPESAPDDPGTGRADVLPRIPDALAYGAEQALVALPRTAIYGLLAAAYALIYGLVGRVNLAFGELAALGGTATGLCVALASSGGTTAPAPALALGLTVAVAAASLHGAVAGRIAFGLIPARAAQASLIATVGLSIALMEYLRVAAGAVPAWIPPVWNGAVPLARGEAFILTITPVSLLTAGIGLSAALALLLFMRRSAFGRAWRAQADDALAASLFGIDGNRLLAGTAAISGGLAGLAGALVAIQFGALGFAGGFQLGLKALAAAVIGGIGSVPGALLGGLAIAAFETLWSAYLPIEGRDIATYLALVLAIVLRPGGLLGVSDTLARQP